TEYIKLLTCLGQAARIIDHAAIAALQRHHLAEFLKCFSGSNELSGHLSALRDGRGHIVKLEHPSRQLQTEFAEIVGSFPAQCVKLSVGGRDLGSLADHGTAAGAQNPAKLSDREIYIEARDGFELVQRAAGVAESAAADHRNNQSGRGGKRRKHQRRLVTDTP